MTQAPYIDTAKGFNRRKIKTNQKKILHDDEVVLVLIICIIIRQIYTNNNIL